MPRQNYSAPKSPSRKSRRKPRGLRKPKPDNWPGFPLQIQTSGNTLSTPAPKGKIWKA
jgi:hypothetical protein